MKENKALRYNEGKLDWTLLDFDALEAMVRVQTFGARKYERDNWKRGMSNETILGCLMRHATALMKGELLDPETKESHAAHVAVNAMYFLHYNPAPKKNVMVDDSWTSTMGEIPENMELEVANYGDHKGLIVHRH